MSEQKNNRQITFWGILKTLFVLMIIVQFVPILFSNLKKSLEDTLSPKPKIGHLTLNGFIGNSTFYVKKIRSFLKDEDILGLFIKISSPGGVPGSSQAIFNELKLFKAKKPIVILVENVCASAAYYVAVTGNTIISQPSSLVGSIGSFAQLPNIKGLMEDWKIKFNFIQSGKYKTAGNPFTETTPQEKEYLQQISDDIYQQFINDVATSRNLDIKEINKWADGKVFTGTQALKLKLIDKIGSMTDAVEEIKKLAKIPETEEIKFIKQKPPSGILKYLQMKEEETDDEVNFSNSFANFINNVLDKVSEKQQIKAQTLHIG
ncbi:MAG: signal peptide peptidase SppA [bacterium]